MDREAVKDGVCRVHEDSAVPCRTDPVQPGGYDLSRWNACRWQTRRDDIMVCLRERCPYQFCGFSEEEMPTTGTPCAWENWYATLLMEQFDELFPRDGLGKYLDDPKARREEYVLALLHSNRAAIRSSLTLQKCFDAVLNSGNMPIDQRPFQQYALAERYRSAAYNRLSSIFDHLPAIAEKAREDRILREMLSQGYWNPLRGDDPPSIEDAPEWIVKKIDGR